LTNSSLKLLGREEAEKLIIFLVLGEKATMKSLQESYYRWQKFPSPGIIAMIEIRCEVNVCLVEVALPFNQMGRRTAVALDTVHSQGKRQRDYVPADKVRRVRATGSLRATGLLN